MGSPPTALVYAFEGFEKDLSEELLRAGASVVLRQERLFLVENLRNRPVWAQVCGLNARKIPFSSISEAGRALRQMNRRWACASQTLHRRSQLIQESVHRKIPTKKIEFLSPPPTEAVGAWALLDANTLIASIETDNAFPLGEVPMIETEEPPSRAYMKLWELFTVHGVRPPPGARVMDLGSSPGGWTWVLAKVGCEVLSVDKAPLAPQVAKSPLVTSLKKDAFKLKAAETGPVDWLFSDLICYPPKLLELVREWRKAGVKNFVCTIKFQGRTDFETMEQFLEIPGSWIVHLNANRHEVTWVLTEKPMIPTS